MTGAPQVKIQAEWATALAGEFQQPYFQALVQFLKQEKQAGQTIYPPGSQIFAAFDATPPQAVRVVILGQDPYHGPGQAHGLCFSVAHGVPVPPSLQNIHKELEADLGIARPAHGHLMGWARQGVLLLNATLTVRAHQAGSHQNHGWEPFTDAAIRWLAQQRAGLVFMLWGRYAQQKGRVIDPERHLVLRAAHPSPLSAHNGFLGCRHFSQANAYLTAQGLPPIDWADFG